MRTHINLWTEIGTSHMGAGFGTVLMRAMIAGWLIALMVWLLPGAESGRVSIIIILTYLVGISGFNHMIAGSTTMFFLVVTKSISRGNIYHSVFLSNVAGQCVWWAGAGGWREGGAGEG